MIAFCHIEKTAGSSLNRLLYRELGWRHCVVTHWLSKGNAFGQDRAFTSKDLKRLKRIYPCLKSISGHSIKPWSDLDDICPDIHFYTFMRDPIMRTISHYQHRVLKSNYTESFHSWISNTDRHNWQVRFLAGKNDFEKAKDMLVNKITFVGIQEYYEKSLNLLSRNFSLEFNKNEITKENKARSDEIKKKILSDKKSIEIIKDANDLDIKLYNIACNIFKNYSENFLYEDEETSKIKNYFLRKIKYISGKAYRNYIYKPAVFVYRNTHNPHDVIK